MTSPPTHDKNFHAIDKDGSLIFDPKCQGCDAPKSLSFPTFIDKEVDIWLTTSKSVDYFEREANYRAALERVREATLKDEDILKGERRHIIYQIRQEERAKAFLEVKYRAEILAKGLRDEMVEKAMLDLTSWIDIQIDINK